MSHTRGYKDESRVLHTNITDYRLTTLIWNQLSQSLVEFSFTDT
jgi:hypothetical protein